MSQTPRTDQNDSLSSRLGFPETTIEIGPTHPAIRRVMTPVGGTASFIVELDDDRITNLEVDIGLGHRGFEKQVESGSWDDALPYVSRLGWASGLHAEIAYCLAVESLAEIASPDRAIWTRMLVGELARVSDHYARLGATMAAIGLRDAENVANAGEELASEALVAATGGGPLVGFSCFGGIRRALPEHFLEGWSKQRSLIDDELTRFGSVATSNPTCTRRLRGVAPLVPEDAIAWSVTGTALRASGISADVRKDRPYLAYGALEFDVPAGEQGDDLDRMLVVIEEIRQSLGMIDQCHKILSSLGPGEVCVSGEVIIPEGEAVATVESSTGELAFFVVSDGVGLPRRIRCRAPSFFHAQVLPTMMVGARLDDLLPTVALMHLVSAECDR